VHRLELLYFCHELFCGTGDIIAIKEDIWRLLQQVLILFLVCLEQFIQNPEVGELGRLATNAMIKELDRLC
jgi:hypothetical protein